MEIEENSDTIKKSFRTFIYGSLRRGEYNHDRFKGFGTHFRGTGAIRGAILKSLGAYPALVPSISPADTVVGEIYDLPEEVHNVILRMENGAGYVYVPCQVEVLPNAEECPGITYPVDASVYMFRSPQLIERQPTVKDGDWTKRAGPRPL